MLLSEAKGLKLVPLIKIVVPPWVEPVGDTNESRLVETSIIVGEPGLTKPESKILRKGTWIGHEQWNE